MGLAVFKYLQWAIRIDTSSFKILNDHLRFRGIDQSYLHSYHSKFEQLFMICWRFPVLHLIRTVDIVQSPQQLTFLYFVDIRIANIICLKQLKQCRLSHGRVISVVDGDLPTTMFIPTFARIYSNLLRLTIPLKKSLHRVQDQQQLSSPLYTKPVF